MMRLAPNGILLVVLALGACDKPTARPGQQTAILTQASPGKHRRIVARVNGSPLLASDVAEQMSDGSSKTQAIEDLVSLELLTQEARRRGIHHSVAVRSAQRRALAEHWLTTTYDENFTPQDIPLPLVQRAYELNLARFKHPELVRVVHILAQASKEDSKEHHRRAKAAALKALSVAKNKRNKLTADTFAAIAGQLRSEVAPVSLLAETLTTPKRGFTVAAFADAAFALKRPGQLSGVVETEFGYHVIFLKKRIAARNDSMRDVEDTIRERIFDDARQTLMARRLRKLRRSVTVSTFPDNLEHLNAQEDLE